MSTKLEEHKQITAYNSRLDRIGIFVSGLCMVHCVVLPVLLSTLPLWGIEILENVYIEAAMILVAFLAGGWAIWRGYRKFHRRPAIPLLFISGLALLVAASFFTSEAAEMITKGAGALFIVTAHILNRQKCCRCAVCE